MKLVSNKNTILLFSVASIATLFIAAIITLNSQTVDASHIHQVLATNHPISIDLGKGNLSTRAWLHQSTTRILIQAKELQDENLDAIKRYKKNIEELTDPKYAEIIELEHESIRLTQNGEYGYAQTDSAGGCIIVQPVFFNPKDTTQWIAIIGTASDIDVVMAFRTKSNYQTPDIIEYCNIIKIWVSNQNNRKKLKDIELLAHHIDENGNLINGDLNEILEFAGQFPGPDVWMDNPN